MMPERQVPVDVVVATIFGILQLFVGLISVWQLYEWNRGSKISANGKFPADVILCRSQEASSKASRPEISRWQRSRCLNRWSDTPSLTTKKIHVSLTITQTGHGVAFRSSIRQVTRKTENSRGNGAHYRNIHDQPQQSHQVPRVTQVF